MPEHVFVFVQTASAHDFEMAGDWDLVPEGEM